MLILLVGFTSALSPPAWPFQWNATLAKINPYNDNIVWNKFFYDWTNGKVSRFDFMNGYYNTDSHWTLNCSIYFTPDQKIWFVFPEEKACNLAHTGIPTRIFI